MHWLRDLSIILLAFETFVMALLPLLLFSALVYGSWWLMRRDHLPAWIKVAQAYLALGRAYIELAMAAIVRPILVLHSALATVQGWLDGMAKFVEGRQ